MRMTEHEGGVRVSALRAQIQEQLLKHSVSAGDIDHKPNGDFNGNGPLPPLPSHTGNAGAMTEHPPYRPPPIPPHHSTSGPDLHRFSTSSDGGSISGMSTTSASKPPIAPKPKELRKSSVSAVFPSSLQGPRPSIVVQRSSAAGSTEDLRERFNGNLSQSEDSSRSDITSVRGLARQFEMNGIPIVARIGLQPPVNRPESTVSSVSLNSVDMSESESDDERPAECVRPGVVIDHLSPNKIGIRRPSALVFPGDPKMHEKIMDELKRQGVYRSSSHQHLFKKRIEQTRAARKTLNEAKHDAEVPNEVKVPLEDETPDGTIPTDVGKLREDRKPRVPDITLSSSSSAPSEEHQDRTESYLSDRSSTWTTCSSEHETVLQYDTGDPEEDKRLKKLHYAANEFSTVQRAFLKYLTDMEVYPAYVQAFGERIGKPLLAPPNDKTQHVVRELETEIKNLIMLHKVLLEQFEQKTNNWTSICPSMAEVIIKHADYLKMCKSFLMKKARFVQELTKLREEDRDFDNATVGFEQKIFKRGVGAVVQQLDQVHQNFMRYKILMMSYSQYLHPESEEFKKANEAIAKLESITQSVNEAMGLPTNEELLGLYERFQYHFNVFQPGRRLIRQGEVLKQTRKEPQPRYVVLFSDYLWVCRVASSVIMTTGLFDLNRSYQIPVDSIKTEASQHEDFEKILYIKSKEKSLIIIFNNVKERDQWNHDINSARDEKKQYKRRMSEAVIREKKTVVILNHESGLNDVSRTSIVEESLASIHESICNSGSPSVPSTPIDEMPGPSTSMTNGEHPLRRISTKRVLRADRDKPLWIPDEASTKCLMEGCGSVFSLLNRRHHCRDCGWLICSSCSGRAPLSKYDFRKELVCPECFAKISDKYNAGNLFPDAILVKSEEGWKVRIKKNKKKDSPMIEILPQHLFVPPHNYGLKRVQIFERVRESDGLVFSKVFVRTKKGTEMQRYAMLTEGMILQFFKAQFDSEPCEQHVIYGFEFKENELDVGGTEFELVHRNQIRTDRKEHVIIFRVEHSKSVAKWSNALNEGLGHRPCSQNGQTPVSPNEDEVPPEPSTLAPIGSGSTET